MKIVFTNPQSVWSDRWERYITDWESATWRLYSGPLELCKDHGQDTANKQRQEELDMQKAATARVNAQQDEMKQALSGDMAGTNGYSPELLAAVKSQFMGQNDATYNSAGNQVRSALLARGGGGGNAPVGGDFVKGLLGLEASKAGTQSSGLTGIDISNLQQMIQNKWNAANILSGQQAVQSNLAGQGMSGASNALNAYVQAKSIPGFLETTTNAFGGAMGKAFGTAVGGGAGKALFPNQPQQQPNQPQQ